MLQYSLIIYPVCVCIYIPFYTELFVLIFTKIMKSSLIDVATLHHVSLLNLSIHTHWPFYTDPKGYLSEAHSAALTGDWVHHPEPRSVTYRFDFIRTTWKAVPTITSFFILGSNYLIVVILVLCTYSLGSAWINLGEKKFSQAKWFSMHAICIMLFNMTIDGASLVLMVVVLELLKKYSVFLL